MRKDISIEKIMLGGDFVNKSALYGCCWGTIDRRSNPDKYKKDKKSKTTRTSLINIINLFFLV